MKIVLFFFSLFVSFSAFSQLPDKASNFVQVHFENINITKIEFDDDEYEVKLDNGCELKFDIKGNWLEIESDFSPLPKSIIDLLPKPVIEYIAKKYPRRAIMKIEKEGNNYEVELSNSVELIFDKKGKFLRKD